MKHDTGRVLGILDWVVALVSPVIAVIAIHSIVDANLWTDNKRPFYLAAATAMAILFLVGIGLIVLGRDREPRRPVRPTNWLNPPIDVP